MSDTNPENIYDRDAIFRSNSPIDPICVLEAVAAIKQALPITPGEPNDVVSRRMHGALRALAALHARDEIELMLGVQVLCAYHAATACWRLGMNLALPHGDSTRHIATAGSAFGEVADAVTVGIHQAQPVEQGIGRIEIERIIEC